MKRRLIRASLIASILAGITFFGPKGGGEGFFPDPTQPVQSVDLISSLMIIGIIWILAFIPWKRFLNRLRGK